MKLKEIQIFISGQFGPPLLGARILGNKSILAIHGNHDVRLEVHDGKMKIFLTVETLLPGFALRAYKISRIYKLRNFVKFELQIFM